MSYNKKVWKSGDRITKEALNNMENGIEAAHQNSGGTGSAAIVDNLNSDSSTSALSAKQGKALNNKIPTKSIVEGGKLYLAKEDGTKLDSGTELPAGGSTIEVVNNLESDSTTAALSAAQGKALNTQYKDIANLSLTKHTDGKVYIKKQDGSLIGTGVEVGNDTDLSKVTMTMSGQTLKMLNDGNQIATVEIPTAVVTDEQLTSIIQSKIDDGSLSALSIEDGSITPNKTDFLNKGNNTSIVNTNFTKYYDPEHGYFGGKGSYGTDLIDISKANKIKAYCGKNYVCWLSYKMDDKTTIMTLDKSDNYPYLFFEESIQLEDGNYLFEYDLNALKKLGVTQIILGFYGNEFNKEVIQIELINENILNKKELSIAPSYEFKISNDNIDDVSIDFEK